MERAESKKSQEVVWKCRCEITYKIVFQREQAIALDPTLSLYPTNVTKYKGLF
jgi:hypothetical protein